MNQLPDIPEQILDAASKGRLVLFIGSGVSQIIGCPSWKEFADIILKDLFDKNLITYYEKTELSRLDSRRILTICKEIYKEKNIQFPDMKNIFKGDREKIDKYKIYKNIYEINAINITTNYDEHLDFEAVKKVLERSESSKKQSSSSKIQQETKSGSVKYLKEELLISNLSNGIVLHLHGSVNDSKNAIISFADYLKHYKEEDYVPILLKKLFNEYTILFIGYGLDEYEILEFLVNKTHKKKNIISHFMLFPWFENQLNLLTFLEKYYESFGIKLIPYSIDKSGHIQLSEIIEMWSKQISSVSKPQSYIDKLKQLDDVL